MKKSDRDFKFISICQSHREKASANLKKISLTRLTVHILYEICHAFSLVKGPFRCFPGGPEM